VSLIPFYEVLEWEEWFAWHPVKIKISKTDWRWFWLRRIDRCWHGVTPDWGEWEYRLKPNGKAV